MEDKNRRNISETFGKYTDSSYMDKNGYNKVREPRNITSDMYVSISEGRPTERKSMPAAQKSQRTAQQKAEKQARSTPISEGRAQSAKPKQNNNTQQKKPVASKKKPPKKSRTPKGEPLSKKEAEMRQPQKKKQAQNKKANEKARQENAKKARRQQELKKNRLDYDKQIENGRSPNEISKKRAAQKKKKRRIRSIVTVVLFLVFIFAFVGIYSYTKGAPIANIIIEGESVYENEQIIESAEISVGLNMLSLREKAINEKVTTSLPYIHSVEIDRKLPDTVTLTVTPTKEKYLIVNDSGYICVDEHEKILSLKKKKLQQGFFRIYGFEYQKVTKGEMYQPSQSNAEKFALVKKIVSALEANGTIKKAVIHVADTDNVKVLYNSKVMIYLGDCDKLEQQINLACNVINETVTDNKTGYIDTRYDDRAYFNEGTMEID